MPLATLLIASSLFTSPITQQVIQYPTRVSEVSGIATVARSGSLPQLGEEYVTGSNSCV